MKRGIGVLAAALLSTSAMAADLGVKAPVYASPAAIAPYNWSGFYIGGNVGYGDRNIGADWSTSETFNGAAVAGTAGSGSFSGNGVLGGAQIGYNYQFGHWVIGAETDWQMTGIKGSMSPVLFGPNSGVTDTLSSSLDWFGTSRLRAGYAYNNWLFYGTGGAAYGQENVSYSAVENRGNASFTASSHVNTIGYAYGGGIEWGFAPGWSIAGEYLHLRMSGPDLAIGATGGPFAASANISTHTDTDVGRFKINYRFP